MSGDEENISVGSGLLGPFAELRYALVPAGVPKGFTALDQGSWDDAVRLEQSLDPSDRRACLVEYANELSAIFGAEVAATLDEPSLRWGYTLVLAHSLLHDGVGVPDEFSPAEREAVGAETHARYETLTQHGALRGHVRLLVDCGPMSGVLAAGPYLARAFLVGPVLLFLRVPIISWLALIAWVFAYLIDLCLVVVPWFGWSLVDRLMTGATTDLRAYERAWGALLFGPVDAPKEALRDLWRRGSGRPGVEALLAGALLQVVLLNVARPRVTPGNAPPRTSTRMLAAAWLRPIAAVLSAVGATAFFVGATAPPGRSGAVAPWAGSAAVPTTATEGGDAPTNYGATRAGAPTGGAAYPNGAAGSGGRASTWGTGPRPTVVTASSSFYTRRESHPVEQAFDGMLETAWNDGVHGDGIGEWIEASFGAPVALDGFRITPGWDHISRHGEDLYHANERIRRLRVLADGQEVGRWDIPDEQREFVVTGLHLRAERVRFVVDAVWRGSHYHDVCVSEIAFVPGREGPSCDVRMDPGAFHLRSDDTPSRAGAVELQGDVSVEVLAPGQSWRNHGEARSYRVRVREGPASGRFGYVFLHPSDLAPRPECPR